MLSTGVPTGRQRKQSCLVESRIKFSQWKIPQSCGLSSKFLDGLKPNAITLASSELAPNMFGASSELASVMEFGFYCCCRTTFDYRSLGFSPRSLKQYYGWATACVPSNDKAPTTSHVLCINSSAINHGSARTSLNDGRRLSGTSRWRNVSADETLTEHRLIVDPLVSLDIAATHRIVHQWAQAVASLWPHR